MLKPIPKDIQVPKVRPAFLSVNNMHLNLQLRLINTIRATFNYLSLIDIPILYGQSTFHFLVHLLGNQVELLNLRDQFSELPCEL